MAEYVLGSRGDDFDAGGQRGDAGGQRGVEGLGFCGKESETTWGRVYSACVERLLEGQVEQAGIHPGNATPSFPRAVLLKQ